MEGLKKSFLVRGNNIVGFSDKNFSTAPIRTVLSFAGQTAPHGYLLCDGASYKVADYPDLYAVIGNTYGGDTENFNVPTVQPSDLTIIYIIKAFHTNEGVDSGVSDDVIEYVNDSLVDKADKSYVDDNFATMDKVESKYSEENVLTSTDWNTLNTRARYYFSGGTPMTNSPEEVPFGLLEVINVGLYCRIQRYFAFNGKLYIRRWSGNSWNEWYRFDGISI